MAKETEAKKEVEKAKSDEAKAKEEAETKKANDAMAKANTDALKDTVKAANDKQQN